jgi:hypothetical protein
LFGRPKFYLAVGVSNTFASRLARIDLPHDSLGFADRVLSPQRWSPSFVRRKTPAIGLGALEHLVYVSASDVQKTLQRAKFKLTVLGCHSTIGAECLEQPAGPDNLRFKKHFPRFGIRQAARELPLDT